MYIDNQCYNKIKLNRTLKTHAIFTKSEIMKKLRNLEKPSDLIKNDAHPGSTTNPIISLDSKEK